VSISHIRWRIRTAIAKLLIWFESHAGLGSWVGAPAGAFVAVCAVWFAAHLEYTRTLQREQVRREADIQEIRSIILNFDPIVQIYIYAVQDGDTGETYLYNVRHMNDAEESAARDLASVPVMQWPSLPAYLHFKRYWYLSIQILETSRANPAAVRDTVKSLASDKKNELTELIATLSP
jgi:hypothetical protein